jgi:hypothetical protein
LKVVIPRIANENAIGYSGMMLMLDRAKPTKSEKKLLVRRLRFRNVAEESCSTIGTKLLMVNRARL